MKFDRESLAKGLNGIKTNPVWTKMVHLPNHRGYAFSLDALPPGQRYYVNSNRRGSAYSYEARPRRGRGATGFSRVRGGALRAEGENQREPPSIEDETTWPSLPPAEVEDNDRRDRGRARGSRDRGGSSYREREIQQDPPSIEDDRLWPSNPSVEPEDQGMSAASATGDPCLAKRENQADTLPTEDGGLPTLPSGSKNRGRRGRGARITRGRGGSYGGRESRQDPSATEMEALWPDLPSAGPEDEGASASSDIGAPYAERENSDDTPSVEEGMRRASRFSAPKDQRRRGRGGSRPSRGRGGWSYTEMENKQDSAITDGEALWPGLPSEDQ